MTVVTFFVSLLYHTGTCIPLLPTPVFNNNKKHSKAKSFHSCFSMISTIMFHISCLTMCVVLLSVNTVFSNEKRHFHLSERSLLTLKTGIKDSILFYDLEEF